LTNDDMILPFERRDSLYNTVSWPPCRMFGS